MYHYTRDLPHSRYPHIKGLDLPLFRQQLEFFKQNFKEQSAKNNPLGRNIFVEEVVPSIEYLLSDASNVITGQNIGVTGGEISHSKGL